MTNINPESFEENNPNKIISEIFSSSITKAEAIEKLRTRLLDLTSRNRLLNYKHPRGRSVQIINNANINLVYDRVYVDEKAVFLKYVPEPDADTYEGKRPDVKITADKLYLDTSFEFDPYGSGGSRLAGLQTLYYPAELEKQLRKIANEAKTAIEETGMNMLFLILGFLEFYESDDSEKPILAPLIAIPISLKKGSIDRQTRTYEYSVEYNGEDVTDNQTLREKIRRDFMLSLPEFTEDQKPEDYFDQIQSAIVGKHRWKVRRQITLGMLSFGKHPIWVDYDTSKNPGLLKHKIIDSIFGGGAHGGGDSYYAEDYKIDVHPEADQPLIYDADSSQHSALIDVLAGKNLVINGPPGTGKSQTITNIIAASLAKGKKVLFVSEKLAALEVVRRKLNHAGLGSFCLELHSHKTEKKKLLKDIQERIEANFSRPSQFDSKIETLRRNKKKLSQYAELIGSIIGNQLGLTVHEVFWMAERKRQLISEKTFNMLGRFMRKEASSWTNDDIEQRKMMLQNLAESYQNIGNYAETNKWWGYTPTNLSPSDNEVISAIIKTAKADSVTLAEASQAIAVLFELSSEMDVAGLVQLRTLFDKVPTIPEGMKPSILSEMFDLDTDPRGSKSSALLANVSEKLNRSRALIQKSETVLLRMDGLPIADQESLSKALCDGWLSDSICYGQLSDAVKIAQDVLNKVLVLQSVGDRSQAPDEYSSRIEADTFISLVTSQVGQTVSHYSPAAVLASSKALAEKTKDLIAKLEQIEAITKTHKLPFDTKVQSLEKLLNEKLIDGLKSGFRLDDDFIEKVRRRVLLPLSGKTLSNLEAIRVNLDLNLPVWEAAFNRLVDLGTRIGLLKYGKKDLLPEIEAMTKIAKSAPMRLLEYRDSAYSNLSAADAIKSLENELGTYKSQLETYSILLYLDSVPEIGELRKAIPILRSKDGFFAQFDSSWRAAKNLHAGLSREKRMLTASQRAEELVGLSAFFDLKSNIQNSTHYRSSIGRLFKGLDTDINSVKSLFDWYQSAKSIFAKHSIPIDMVDITSLPATRIVELEHMSESVMSDVKLLISTQSLVGNLVGNENILFKEKLQRGYDEGFSLLRKLAEQISETLAALNPIAESYLIPTEILRLLEAKKEILTVSEEIKELVRSEATLREVAGRELAGAVMVGVTPLNSALNDILEIANKANRISDSALKFGDSDCPIELAISFAEARIDLDNLWCLLSQNASKPVNPWSCLSQNESKPVHYGLVELIRIAKKEAEFSLSWFLKCVKISAEGCTPAQIGDALRNNVDANNLVAGLESSPEVKRILGYVFQGIETNLNAISITHKWGAEVSAIEFPKSIQQKILSSEAANYVSKGAELSRVADNAYKATRSELDKLKKFGEFSWTQWQENYRSLDGRDLPSEISDRLAGPESDPDSVLEWARYLVIRSSVNTDGLEAFVDALENLSIPATELTDAFELSVYQAIGRGLYSNYPEFGEFDGSSHENARAKYCELDREIISLTGKNLAYQIASYKNAPEGNRGITVGEYTEMHLLRKEMSKQRRHIPIRQLLKRAGTSLQQWKPCFMMGPLSVAQYLEQGKLKFDLVVMDEASQLKPEDAIGAIVRGSQLIVVGDPKQLPPTSFFDRRSDSDDEDEDDAPAALTGTESILDICQQLFTPVRSLRWHYRSHHESLIAFSNHHFYKNLIVFPSPHGQNINYGVKFRYVENGVYMDRQNLQEAQRVVDAVLEHILKRPDLSLGVVTLNQTQRELIEELLDEKLKTFENTDEYLLHWEEQGYPFFIKNLENVQGDERDVIFISTTFGKAPGTDKIRQNFGPISQPDGWRRLNVLFTRAKNKIELYSSMLAEDIIVDERTPLGTKTLKEYLDFARRGILASTDITGREPDSDFEISVADVVKGLGYQVQPQLGVAGFFIDMAVRNPDRPGEYLAAIECDGATYHSGFSVRDRDRIRQDILEALGWKDKIYRIWSTDWFYNPRREIEKLIKFLHTRRQNSLIESDESDSDDASYSIGDMPIEVDAAAFESEIEVFDDDFYVEVGDRVTYRFSDDSDRKYTVRIVDRDSNPKLKLINENSPLAKALLGLCVGEDALFEIPGKDYDSVEVLKISRYQNELDVSEETLIQRKYFKYFGREMIIETWAGNEVFRFPLLPWDLTDIENIHDQEDYTKFCYTIEQELLADGFHEEANEDADVDGFHEEANEGEDTEETMHEWMDLSKLLKFGDDQLSSIIKMQIDTQKFENLKKLNQKIKDVMFLKFQVPRCEADIEDFAWFLYWLRWDGRAIMETILSKITLQTKNSAYSLELLFHTITDEKYDGDGTTNLRVDEFRYCDDANSLYFDGREIPVHESILREFFLIKGIKFSLKRDFLKKNQHVACFDWQ